MATRKEFVDAAIQCYENHDVYVGTGNGEPLKYATFFDVYRMEKKYARRNEDGSPLWGSDARRDCTFIGKQLENYGDNGMKDATMEDCSGLIVKILRLLGIIKPSSDYRAKDLQKMATKISLSSLQPGDLVFDKTSEATHVGVYIGDPNYVIDSRGRDKGVIKSALSSYSWKIGGRLDWFSDDIPILTRNLYYKKDDLLKGKDVLQCQEQLKKRGYDPGVCDGIFGIKTEAAVINFQTVENLEVDGIVGPVTWQHLFTEV